MALSVDIQVLGPLRVTVDGAEQRVGGRRERLVLALLVAAGGRHLTAERLIDEVWGDGAPPSAAGSLQVAISRLRTALEPGRTTGSDPSVLVRGPAGYALVGAGVDAVAFSAAVTEISATTPQHVVKLTDEALGLWQQEPYADLVDVPSLAAEAARLVEDRLRLLEARADAYLALGRHVEAQALLAPLVDAHPFRERLWSLLALSLYRSDRQAEALETLRRLRTSLVDELGVDPSASVRVLEEDMLVQAPHLEAPAPAGPSRDEPHRTVAQTSTRVVGRLGELVAVDEALAALIDRHRGGVLLLTGEAGIGKSFLAAELARRAVERGAQVSVGRCYEADVAPAYWPWLPVLRDLAGPNPPDEVSVLLGGLGSVAMAEVVDAGAAALRTYDAAARVLGSVGRPLVVVLEDLHWSDTSSLRLLTFASEMLRDRPVLFVATARDVDPHAYPSLTQALAGLARLGARRVRVPRLDAADVGALVADILDPDDEALIEVLARRTDGNPFFVLEMARLLAADDRATAQHAENLEVPDGIADVLRMRVLRLDPDVRETLAVASVVGRHFDAALVSAAVGRPVLDHLDEAVATRVVQDRDVPGTYQFVHALTRETLYGDLPSGRRARLHSEVGMALAARLPHEPELVAEVAHHHFRAATFFPEKTAVAVGYGRDAAEASERRGAFDEALALWSRTVEVERRMPTADRVRRHELLLRLASVRQRLGDMAGMQAALDEAVELARPHHDYRRMAEAATSFRSSGVWHWREMGSEDAAMVEVLRTCVEHVDDVGLRARAWANLGLEHYVAWRSDEADFCGTRSLELARESGDPEVLRDCLSACEVALWGPGNAHEHERRARELLGLPLSPEHEVGARFQLAMALHHQGLTEDADQEMGSAFRIAAELRHTGCDVPLAWWRWLRAAETDSPDAAEVARRALALHRRTTMVGLTVLTGLATIGSAPDGSPVPADVLASAHGHPNRSYRVAVAYALSRAGDLAGSARMLGDLAPPEGHDYGSLYAACLRVEVLAALQDTEALPETIAMISPFANEVATYGSVVSVGSANYFVGRGLVALGDLAEGRARLEDAVEMNARTGCRRWERIARLELDRLTRAGR